jgi:hypothetical protein
MNVLLILRGAQERAPQDDGRMGGHSNRAGCGEPPRAIAHIGVLFSDLVDRGQLSFLTHSPDSIILPELAL